MAAEAPRSSASSADSYIGSLISLTSKSEIRYEGILITINTEESSIALRNVRSFGTEGRKKDGPQVPPSDKIYEYILFCGSDIKDLQVKSSPSVQATTPVPNDPAIIQSHYPPAPVASTSLTSAATGSIQDPNVQNSQIGIPRPTFQSNPPLYQPSGSIGPWIPPQPPSPANNMSGLPLPIYWQGMYGNLNGFPPQQQSLLRPPPGVSVPPTIQQTMHYPAVNVSYPTVGSNVPTTKLSDSPSPLLPPLTPGIQNLPSSVLPGQSLAAVSESSTSLIPNKPSAQSFPTAALSTGLPLATPLTTTIFDKTASSSSVSDKSKTVHSTVLPHLSVSESITPLASTSTYLNEGPMPSLVTPGQLLQSGPTTVSMPEPSSIAQKDVEVIKVSSPKLPITPPPAETDVQEPILPLPSPSDNKVHATTVRIQYGNRGGRERGRGYKFSRPMTRFTEDFDFTAMNEKFNKDEVWGDLGKSSKVQDDGDGLQEDDYGASKHEIKPGYVKDDFFDSLSCDALDGGSHNGRTKFSEQLRKDTETFGYMPRPRGARGGRGPGYGGRSRGSYYGRGYGYVGRGRGYNYPYRAM